MIGFVYMWKNLINNKKYIGVHKGSITDNYIGSGTYFRRAVNLYGIENFERIILHEEYESVENLYRKEYEIITKYNAIHDSNFYNIINYDFSNPDYIENKQKRKMKIFHKYVNDIKFVKCIFENIDEALDDTWIAGRGKSNYKLIHKIENNKKIVIGVKSVEPFIKDGWHLGLGPFSEEHKQNLSKSLKNSIKVDGNPGEKNGMYGKSWYNDGIKNKPYVPGTEPAGWVKGALFDIGGINNPFYGKKHTEESKQKMRDAAKPMRGPDNPFYGKKHTEESKQKMIKNKKGKVIMRNPETNKKKFVDKTEIDLYESMGYYFNKDKK